MPTDSVVATRYYFGHVISGRAAEYYASLNADLAQRFGVKNLAETQPPHFTLRPPFEVDSIADVVDEYVESLASGCQPLPFSLEGFGSFPLTKEGITIFLKVVPNKSLQKCVNYLAIRLAEFGDDVRPAPLPIKLHVSVARYLAPKQWIDILAYLTNLPKPRFDLEFDHVALMAKSGGRWELKKKYHFAS